LNKFNRAQLLTFIGPPSKRICGEPDAAKQNIFIRKKESEEFSSITNSLKRPLMVSIKPGQGSPIPFSSCSKIPEKLSPAHSGTLVAQTLWRDCLVDSRMDSSKLIRSLSKLSIRVSMRLMTNSLVPPQKLREIYGMKRGEIDEKLSLKIHTSARLNDRLHGSRNPFRKQMKYGCLGSTGPIIELCNIFLVIKWCERSERLYNAETYPEIRDIGVCILKHIPVD